MRLSAVHAYIKAQILANATLAAFGEPITASLESDDDTIKALIDERLRDPGICITVGEVTGTGISTLHQGHAHAMRASLEIFIVEKVAAPTHTPRGNELVELVVAAVTTGRRLVEWQGHEPLVSENGYSLNILGFSIPVTVTQ